MAQASPHPRRRPQTPPTTRQITLRKSATFNSSTGVSSDICDPVSVARFLPKRSPTSSKSLEDLLFIEAPPSREESIAKLLKQLDDQLEGRVSNDSEESPLKEEDVLAIPRGFLLNGTDFGEPMDVDKREEVVTTDHHHDSDSGIGSSIASPKLERRVGQSTRTSARTNITSSHSAITKSFCQESTHPSGHFLSDDAVKRIQRHIVKPILDESSLEEFHPLVEDIPRRIGAKFINNLRDLEKTLFYLAPDFSSSPSSFLKFCETSIRCLHTTVDQLCERDQRLPTDRPYTNNYFLDLVEQIRRYAQIMARTREKEERGEELDEMDYSPDEDVAIEGGLSLNGRPAELVRKKNGKLIPICPENAEAMSSKRALSDDELDDDDVHRSMARRRKSDKAGDVMQVCGVCRKEFPRPCDLTKHEKTHSRPWKCTEPKCRYHDLGWPTEKERDRHVNDKHSSSPHMFKCKFPPCPYASKRESNCKQHMEKAHNWEYVRSKSNGRKKAGTVASSSNNMTPTTPLTPFASTPASANQPLNTPESVLAPSPWMQNESAFTFDARLTPAPSLAGLYEQNTSRRQSSASGSALTFSSGISPDQPLSLFENVSPLEPEFNSPSYNDAVNANFTFPGTFQQPTPALSVGQNFEVNPSNTFAMGQQNHTSAAGVQQLSPTGQGDLTLYSPCLGDMSPDEGFVEPGFHADFTLFDTIPTSAAQNDPNQSANWFPDVNLGTVGGQFDNFNLCSDAFSHPFLPQ